MKKLLLLAIAIVLSLAAQPLQAQQRDSVRKAARVRGKTPEQTSSSSAATKVKIKRPENYKDLADYLPGRVAGLTVSGPEGSRIILIRGISTFYGDPAALIVVDGTDMDFESANSAVNIQDIESVEVLKDGGDYGVRGANGVVIIKTKISNNSDDEGNAGDSTSVEDGSGKDAR